MLRHAEGIPSQDQVVKETRTSPMQWNPIETLLRYELQSVEYFLEQKEAISFNV